MSNTHQRTEGDAVPGGWIAQLVPVVLFLLIGWGLLVFFVTIVEPTERKPRKPFTMDYSEQPLADVLARDRFDAIEGARTRCGNSHAYGG